MDNQNKLRTLLRRALKEDRLLMSIVPPKGTATTFHKPNHYLVFQGDINGRFGGFFIQHNPNHIEWFRSNDKWIFKIQS